MILTLLIALIVGFIAWAINDRLPYSQKWVGQVVILALALVYVLENVGHSTL